MNTNSKKIKKEGFFKAFIKSIKDFDKYEDFALDSIGKTTMYLFKLIAIFTVIVAVLTTYRFSKALNKVSEYYDSNISQLTYKNGILEVNDNQKLEANIDDIYQNVTIDTSELTNEQIEAYKKELQEKSNGFLLLRDKILYKNEMVNGITEGTYQEILKKYNIQTMDKQTIPDIINGNRVKIYAVILVTTFIYMIAIMLLKVFRLEDIKGRLVKK